MSVSPFNGHLMATLDQDTSADYNRDYAVDLFINGLPITTFELKNNLTKQAVEDAVEQ